MVLDLTYETRSQMWSIEIFNISSNLDFDLNTSKHYLSGWVIYNMGYLNITNRVSRNPEHNRETLTG